MGWIQTYTGKHFDPERCGRDDIAILDIAHALSNLCRFNGHCRTFYSVAQHSVLVSRIMPEALALEGLLHDAAEAYLGDITRPIKSQLLGSWFHLMECRVNYVIVDRFGLRSTMYADLLQEADDRALATEARDLMGADARRDWGLDADPVGVQIVPMTPEEAFNAFQDRFEEARSQKSGVRR